MSSGPDLVSATGVVLAGGASRRMGQDKAALILDGETLLARAVGRLARVTRDVIVIGPRERAEMVPGVRVVGDTRPGLGPLGGIYSALLAADTPPVFVVACDMPFVRPPLVRHLLGLAHNYDIVVPRTARGTEQLHAVYGQACLPAVAALLDAGELAVANLYQTMRTRIVTPDEWAPYDPEGISTFNANTPEEWTAAQVRAARGD